MLHKLLLLLSMLFWAWQIDVMWLGMVLAGLLGAAHMVGNRFAIDRVSCHQIGDLCLLIAFATLAVYWLDSSISKAMFPTLRLLPIALFPMLILQYIHQRNSVPRSALLMAQRKYEDVPWLDIQPMFVVLCLFSAGASDVPSVWYFPVLVLFLLGLMLLQAGKSCFKRKFRLIALFSAVSALAYWGQLGLVELQHRLELRMNAWMVNQVDTSQTNTAIGSVGQLKLSDEIVFRVKADFVPIPLLLKTASYQRYAYSQWFAGAWKGEGVAFDEKKGWLLQENIAEDAHLTVFQSFPSNRMPLALPMGSVSLQHVPASMITIAQGQSVMADLGQSFAAFRVGFAFDHALQQPPQAADWYIGKAEAEAVQAVAKELGLQQIKLKQGEQAVLDKLHTYFQQKYRYVTWLEAGNTRDNPLSAFLLHSHKGHCEYFASASTLILREVGIAARYAVGYSMQEYDAASDLYVVRGRDAHAWTLAFVDGAWVNVDNTPPDWFALEDADRSALQALKDFFSGLKFRIQQWRYTDSASNTGLWLTVLLVLVAFLAWRILRRVKVKDIRKDEAVENNSEQMPTAWMLLEDELEAAGFSRFQGETLKNWLKRVGKDELLPFVDIVYRLRFTDVGISPAQHLYLEQSIGEYRRQFKPSHNESSKERSKT